MTMPLAKLYQFAHCALLYAGAATRWRFRTADEDAALRSAAARLRAQRAQAPTEKCQTL